MPGPGGGGHGGGGGRGGGFGGGGGFHGGGHGPGFGGVHHHPPHHHHPHHRPFFGGFYPRRHYYGGSGCLGVLMAPVILTLFLLAFLLSMCQNGLNVQIGGGYNEEQFQDYADDQYALHFSDSGAYEDNLLIVVLTEENHSDFYYIAWVGDHIAGKISNLMGNNSTVLGRAMNNCINESNYKYSLDSNLADVMNTMTEEVLDLGLEKPFTCTETVTMQATFVNNTDLPMTDATVEAALQNFTATTGIPLVLVVEDAADVFVSNSSTVGRSTLIRIAVVGVIIVALVVVLIKKQTPKPTN